MTEVEWRNQVVQYAKSWVGTKEGDARHREIVQIYNSIGPWPITVDSPWCAAFASVVAHQAGIDAIVNINSSCGNIISWFRRNGEFVDGNTYQPSIGDYVFYDWQQDEEADHVGIVVWVSGNTYGVCEGNRDGHGEPDYVGIREVSIGSSLVYGIGLPNYAMLAEGGVAESRTPVEYTRPKTETWESWMEESRKNWLRRYRFDAGFEGMEGGFTLGEYDGPNNPPLRILFSIEKGDMEAQNNSNFKIYNLGRAHREMLATPNCYVRFSGGYGTRLPVLTEGIVTRTIDSFDGGNLVTDVEIMDIRRTIRDTYVALSYKSAVNGETVIDDIIQQMGLPGCTKAPGLVWRNYSRGFSFVGAALKAIEKVCVDHGYVCTTLNGDIDIHRPGESSKTQAVVLSAETGLIGNPKRLIETTADGVYYLKGWEVEYMLNGTIDLGSLVKLESPFLKGGSGLYDVVQLRMSGDSMGEDWRCTAKLQDPYFADEALFDPRKLGTIPYENTDTGWPEITLKTR